MFEYTAFERVLSKIAHRFGKWRIGLPMIGMGLAGGDPERIMPLIEGVLRLFEIALAGAGIGHINAAGLQARHHHHSDCICSRQ